MEVWVLIAAIIWGLECSRPPECVRPGCLICGGLRARQACPRSLSRGSLGNRLQPHPLDALGAGCRTTPYPRYRGVFRIVLGRVKYESAEGAGVTRRLAALPSRLRCKRRSVHQCCGLKANPASRDRVDATNLSRVCVLLAAWRYPALRGGRRSELERRHLGLCKEVGFAKNEAC